jgi:hypothetical protein
MKGSAKMLLSIGLFALTGCAGASAAAAESPAVSISDNRPTYSHNIQPIFIEVCGGCHGPMETAGLNLTTYEGALRGGFDGPVIVPGSPDSSELVKRQSERHYGQLSEKDQELVIEWISAGAPE